MASKAKTKKEPKQAGPTRAEFDTLAGNVSTLVDMMTKAQAQGVQAVAAVPQPTIATSETALDKEVRKASADDVNPVNPAWVEKAEEILGEKLDHCEVFYPKRGGSVFTLVIKNEFSNASIEYLSVAKVDRRSKEIGNEGIEGVEQWCKLVAANLNRSKPLTRTSD